MEFDILTDMARAFHAGGFSALVRSDGFIASAVSLGALCIMSVIAMAIWQDDLSETPLARFFGLAPKTPSRSLGEIEADWKELETWRDLDGDNKRDF